jgi:hypothetical protein
MDPEEDMCISLYVKYVYVKTGNNIRLMKTDTKQQIKYVADFRATFKCSAVVSVIKEDSLLNLDPVADLATMFSTNANETLF